MRTLAINQNGRTLSVAVIAAVALTGCTTGRGDLSMRPNGSAELYYGTETGVTNCPVTKEPDEAAAALASVFIAGAVKAGVERIGAALAEAAKEHTSKVTAERNVYLHLDDLKCVTIARGWFVRDPGNKITDNPLYTASLSRLSASSEIEKGQFRRLWTNGFWLAGEPDFVFEGEFLSVQAQKTAGAKAEEKSSNIYTLLPRFAVLNETAEARLLRPGSDRHVSIFLGFEDVAADLDIEKSAGATIVIGKMNQGLPVEWPSEEDLPKANRNNVNGESINRPPFESEMFKVMLGEVGKPYRLKTLVTETQGESEFLGFVSNVFDNSKEGLTTELTNLADPEKRKAAAEKEASEEKTALDALDTARSDLISKLADCQSGTSGFAGLAAEARKAMRAYDTARFAIGQNTLFSQSDYEQILITNDSNVSIGSTDPKTNPKVACQNMLNKL